ncbi:NADAR family protein [Actinoplanes sp. NPDC023936]|uniref:NADAR family protein n=1 Tax=Actinoplanes sp. NPDC023936 TaxID=3154910 RepID=UPI0033CEA3C6
MALDRRTYRTVDGERIEGTWRPIFIRNGRNYFLTDLLIFADGALYCWEWVDLEGLRSKLESGWVATALEPGVTASAHHLASWVFADPAMALSAEDLLGEVADEIEQLNGRPDSTSRCMAALDRYLASRSEEDREALRRAYLAIPGHLRVYALGDMDYRDWPLQVLSGLLGPDGEPVTEEDRAEAFAYFAGRDQSVGEWAESRPLDGPDQPSRPTVKLAVLGRFPAEPDVAWLRNERPTAIEIGGRTYPSAVHAYWALAVTDDAAREAIQAAATPVDAEAAAGRATIRRDWPEVRLTAMHAVLRAKFGQHADLAGVLLGTGDARIEYNLSSAYWSGGSEGRNWLGRLLELVRSELRAERAGFVAGRAMARTGDQADGSS